MGIENPLSNQNAVENPNPSFLESLGIKIGDQATIERSNGDIETDWKVSGYNHIVADDATFIEVKKPDPKNGQDTLRKVIPLDDFRRLNSQE